MTLYLTSLDKKELVMTKSLRARRRTEGRSVLMIAGGCQRPTQHSMAVLPGALMAAHQRGADTAKHLCRCDTTAPRP